MAINISGIKFDDELEEEKDLLASDLMTESVGEKPPEIDISGIKFDEPEDKTFYLEDVDKTVSVPGSADIDQANEMIQVEVYGEKKEDFVGNTKISGWNLLKGAGRLIAELPQIVGVGIQESGELGELKAQRRITKLTDQLIRRREIETQMKEDDPNLGLFKEFIEDYKLSKELSKLPRDTFLTDFELKQQEAKIQVGGELADVGRKLNRSNAEWVQNIGLTPDPGLANKILFDLGGVGTSIFVSIGLSWVTRTNLVTPILFGAIQKAQLFQEAEEKGIPIERRKELSDRGAVMEAVLEFVGLEIFFKYMRGNKTLIRTLVRTGTQGFQEMLQQGSEEFIRKVEGLSDDTWQEMFVRIGYSGLLGLVGGIGPSVFFTIAENKGITGDLRKAGFNDKEINTIYAGVLNGQREPIKQEVKKMLEREAEKQSTETQPKVKATVENLKKVEKDPEVAPEELKEEGLPDVPVFENTKQAKEFGRGDNPLIIKALGVAQARLGETIIELRQEGRIDEAKDLEKNELKFINIAIGEAAKAQLKIKQDLDKRKQQVDLFDKEQQQEEEQEEIIGGILPGTQNERLEQVKDISKATGQSVKEVQEIIDDLSDTFITALDELEPAQRLVVNEVARIRNITPQEVLDEPETVPVAIKVEDIDEFQKREIAKQGLSFLNSLTREGGQLIRDEDGKVISRTTGSVPDFVDEIGEDTMINVLTKFIAGDTLTDKQQETLDLTIAAFSTIPLGELTVEEAEKKGIPTFKEWVELPESTQVPSGSILSVKPEQITQEFLEGKTNTELEALSILLGIPKAGTKQFKIDRILLTQRVKEQVDELGITGLQQLSGKELKSLLKSVNQKAIGKKNTMAFDLFAWVEQIRRNGRIDLQRQTYNAFLSKQGDASIRTRLEIFLSDRANSEDIFQEERLIRENRRKSLDSTVDEDIAKVFKKELKVMDIKFVGEKGAISEAAKDFVLIDDADAGVDVFVVIRGKPSEKSIKEIIKAAKDNDSGVDLEFRNENNEIILEDNVPNTKGLALDIRAIINEQYVDVSEVGEQSAEQGFEGDEELGEQLLILKVPSGFEELKQQIIDQFEKDIFPVDNQGRVFEFKGDSFTASAADEDGIISVSRRGREVVFHFRRSEIPGQAKVATKKFNVLYRLRKGEGRLVKQVTAETAAEAILEVQLDLKNELGISLDTSEFETNIAPEEEVLTTADAEQRFASELQTRDDKWGPLEIMFKALNIPEDQLGGFMYMGDTVFTRADGKSVIIKTYKHGISRNSIHIGDDGIFYVFNAGGYRLGSGGEIIGSAPPKGMPADIEKQWRALEEKQSNIKGISDKKTELRTAIQGEQDKLSKEFTKEWIPVSKEQGEEILERTFKGIEEQGFSRNTKYDSEFMKEKSDALEAAGFTMFSFNAGDTVEENKKKMEQLVDKVSEGAKTEEKKEEVEDLVEDIVKGEEGEDFSKPPVTPPPTTEAAGEEEGEPDPKPTIALDEFIANRGSKPITAKILDLGADLLEDIVRQSEDFIGVLSTRVGNISPDLKRRLRKFDFDLLAAIRTDTRGVVAYLKGINKIPKNDRSDLDLALKNGDVGTIRRINRENGLEESYERVKSTLEGLYTRAEAAGIETRYLQDFWPRVIKNPRKLLEKLHGSRAWSQISAALQEKETELGRVLNEEEKAYLVNTLLRGFNVAQIRLQKPNALKERKIDFVTADLNRFYADSEAAIISYITTVNEAIEANKFFGKSRIDKSEKLTAEQKKDLSESEKARLQQRKSDLKFANIKDSIGVFVMEEVNNGNINAADEAELTKLLDARFVRGRISFAFGVFKDISYITILGNPINALTQIGDLAFSVFKSGVWRTTKAFFNASVKRSAITKESIGIDRVAAEFTSGARRTERAVRLAFKLSGLSFLDNLGKETTINAVIDRYRSIAKKPTPAFLEMMDRVLGDEAAQTIQDLKDGAITENVKFLAFNELADVQPITLSEVPVNYLKAKNGKIFYALKTYQIKLLDVFRNEVFAKMQTDPVEGITAFIRLVFALVSVNATADMIKNFVMGRPFDVSDLLANNILKIMGFNRYTIYRVKADGPARVLAEQILPPTQILDNIYKDGETAFKIGSTLTFQDVPELLLKARSVQNIPLGGKLFYWWVGRGRELSAKERTRLENKEAEIRFLKSLTPERRKRFLQIEKTQKQTRVLEKALGRQGDE